MPDSFANNTVHIEMSITHTNSTGQVRQVLRTASYPTSGDNPRYVPNDVRGAALTFADQVLPTMVESFGTPVGLPPIKV